MRTAGRIHLAGAGEGRTRFCLLAARLRFCLCVYCCLARFSLVRFLSGGAREARPSAAGWLRQRVFYCALREHWPLRFCERAPPLYGISVSAGHWLVANATPCPGFSLATRTGYWLITTTRTYPSASGQCRPAIPASTPQGSLSLKPTTHGVLAPDCPASTSTNA